MRNLDKNFCYQWFDILVISIILAILVFIATALGAYLKWW
jgi:hypothetical protein